MLDTTNEMSAKLDSEKQRDRERKKAREERSIQQ